MSLITSWVESANAAGCPFPLNNLPYGVFSTAKLSPRCGVALGDQVLDVGALVSAGLIKVDASLFVEPHWNAVMEAGTSVWQHLRDTLQKLLAADGDRILAEDEGLRGRVFHPLADPST